MPQVRSAGAVMSRHRRRAVVLAVVAAMLLLLAVGGFGNSAPAPTLPMQQVVIARHAIPAGHRIVAGDLAVGAIAVPWVSPHQLNDPVEAIGRRAAVALPGGAPLMDSEVGEPVTKD